MFPSLKIIRKLVRLKSPLDIATFNLDKVTIALEKPWRAESFSIDIGVKPQKKRLKNGFIYFVSYRGYDFQIYQGLGRNRSLQFNPRHLASFSEFETYVYSVIGNEPYHITGVHFSWLFSKKYFTVEFLLWSLWTKGLKIKEIRNYEDARYKLSGCGKVQQFKIGNRPFAISCYDSDAHNSNKKREEKKKVHGVINLEIQCGRKVLQEYGIRTLTDLSAMEVPKPLQRIEFYTPSKMCFRNTPFDVLYRIWEKKGCIAMSRQVYSQSKNIESFNEAMVKLRVGKSTLKEVAIQIAKSDWRYYVDGKKKRNLGQIRKIFYDFRKPLFGKGFRIEDQPNAREVK